MTMLLLIICIAVAIGGGLLWVIWNAEWDFRETIAIAGAVLSVVAIIVSAVMVVMVVVVNINPSAARARNQQEYSSLVYQLENNLYDNDNDLGKKELYKEITEWNMNVAEGKIMEHDLWVGIFYADFYGELDYIELHN